MRYLWLLEGKAQWYYKFYGQPLKSLGNYPSKHHTAGISKHVRPYYVHMKNSPTLLPRDMKPTLVEGVLKSLGIPTQRNPYYQALVISLVWLTPLSFPVTKYLTIQEYSRDMPLTTTIQE